MQTEQPIIVGSKVVHRGRTNVGEPTVCAIHAKWLLLQESPTTRPYVGDAANYQRLLEVPEGYTLVSAFETLRGGDLVYEDVERKWEVAKTGPVSVPTGFLHARPIIGEDYEYVPYEIVLAEGRLSGFSTSRRYEFFAHGKWISSTFPNAHLAYRRKTAEAVARDKAAEEAKRPIAVGDTVKGTLESPNYQVLAIVDEKWMAVRRETASVPFLVDKSLYHRVATK